MNLTNSIINRSVQILLFLLTLMGMSSSPAMAAEERTYTIGIVPQFEARKLLATWGPVFTTIRAETGIVLNFEGSKNIAAFEQGLNEGRFDFAYMNPYHFLIAQRAQGYLPLVRSGKDKFGVLVVAKDSPLKDVKGLNGKRIAFPSPNALGAALLMRAELVKTHNVSFEADYVGTHSSAYLNVALGKAAAAGGVMGTFRKQPQQIQDRLRVFYETARFAAHPLTAHPRVPEEDREVIKSLFLKLGESDAGMAMLGKINMPAIRPAVSDDYQSLGEQKLEDFYVDPNG